MEMGLSQPQLNIMKKPSKKKEAAPSLFKIEPTVKNCILEKTIYSKEGIEHALVRWETYCWGFAVIKAKKRELPPATNSIILTDFVRMNHEYTGGSASEWDYPTGMADEEREEIVAAYDKDDDAGLEKLGWQYHECEDSILPPYKVTKVKKI